MSTIINLRGTSGSGKSTVVFNMRQRFPHKVLEYFGKRGNRPLVYQFDLPSGACFVFGAYHTQCGGCDTITSYGDVLPPLLSKYAKKGNILFEGLLLSGSYGRVGEHLSKLQRAGHTVIYAFLDTPLETCLARIEQRRQAKGKIEPLNPENTISKYRATIKDYDRFRHMGLNVVRIDHKRPFSQVMRLLGLEVQEPKVVATANSLRAA